MSMLNTHSFMPASASAAGSGTAVGISDQAHGAAATALFALGVTLLVLTAIFAFAAIRGLLPRRAERVRSQ
jgi:ABC-type phosphate transport system permease subunit